MPTPRFFLSAILAIVALAMIGYASGSLFRALAALRDGDRADGTRTLVTAAAVGLVGLILLVSLALRLLRELGVI